MRDDGPIDLARGFSLIEVLTVLSLMALMAIVLGTKLDIGGRKNWRVYKTCQIMEEIKEAIIGRPGLYCNGIRQFSDYVSDMGCLPDFLDEKGYKIDLKNIDQTRLTDILQRRQIVQPRALWTRSNISNEYLWAYRVEGNIWAGWRGPYIDPPPDSILKDAWGNPIIFIMGELATYKGKTYRCIKTHESTATNPHQPGRDEDCWKKLKDYITATPWFDPKKLFQRQETGHVKGEMTDVFYNDALVMMSYGEDGRPGGKGLNKDLIVTIYRKEWTGEVAGHLGYRGNPYVRSVVLHCPKKGKIEDASIEIVDNDNGVDVGGETIFSGINFRFGTACERDDPDCKIGCDYSDSACSYTNFKKLAVPIGIRSIVAGGKTYIFPVEATGNWVGTIR